MLRSARYSTAGIVHQDGDRRVRKHRRFYAPLFIWLGGPLARILNTGVRILPQRDWEERERRIYRSLYGTSIRVDADGGLVLPLLAGRTLATWLDDDVTRVLAASFASVWRRSLPFHLAQAGLSLSCFREVGRLLRERN